MGFDNIINIAVADLTKQPYECIVNSANGIGPMGRGIAGALKRAGGDAIQSDAFAVCGRHSFTNRKGMSVTGYDAGQAYLISSGRLRDNGVKNIVCAVTMWQPNDPTSVEICKSALHAAMAIVLKEGFKSVGFPAFGTGVGMLNKTEVANMMVSELDAYKKAVQIHINDIDKEFIIACANKQQEIEKWDAENIHPAIAANLPMIKFRAEAMKKLREEGEII
jgi:O-acetyl-ADP-ribose deacetylase (regulator of RNase III)